MSIECMSAVMNRYPGGGGERLVALALADNAANDGRRIFPSVGDLARRAYLSPRAVQRHLQGMVAAGWLVVVHVTSGRRGDTNEYRISPQWLDGQACVPPAVVVDRQPRRKPKQMPLVTPDPAIGTGDKLAPVKVDQFAQLIVHNSGDEVSAQVTKQVVTGDTSVTQPIMNHQNTNTPLTPLPAPNCGQHRPNSRKKPNRPTSGLAGKQGAKAAALNLPTGTRWLANRHRVESVGDRIGLGKWDQRAFERASIDDPYQAAQSSYDTYRLNVERRVAALRTGASEVANA